MFVVTNAGVATLFCLVTMLGWGSWANTQKLAGKDKWAFPLYYWDYSLAVFVLGIVFAATLGSFGGAGMGAAENFRQAGREQILRAIWSGVSRRGAPARADVRRLRLRTGADRHGYSVEAGYKSQGGSGNEEDAE
jgi:glucose uptake protein